MTFNNLSDHFETPVGSQIVVHTFIQRTDKSCCASHLLVCNQRSWLVDCHDRELAKQIAALGLPLPTGIFHTHIQPEHTRESEPGSYQSTDGNLANTTEADAGFPAETAIYVHESLRVLASDPAAYDQLKRTTWDDPFDWPQSLGQEQFGVAGSVTMLPPVVPLEVTHTFKADDTIQLGTLDQLDRQCKLTFKVIALPGHGGAYASGFLLLHNQKPLALFSGDLLCHHAKLVNVYDLEFAYGKTRLDQLPATLRTAAALGAECFFPATGPVMRDGPAQALQLASNIELFGQACQWRSGQFKRQPESQPPRIGRWFKHADGIYQLNQSGNSIVLIDAQGKGLLIDPGPCDFGDDSRTRRFEKDLDTLHQQAGLVTIERLLITHFHGDHIDMTSLMRERYPQVRVASWGPVADVISRPEQYPYPCTLPWYNLGGATHVHCDDRLRLDIPYHWNDVAIRTLHLPGHCYVHAAYLLNFRGLRLAITGDTIQSCGDADTLGFIIANDSVPDEHRGQLKGLYALVREEIDLNLGGHSSFFHHPRPVYEETIRRVEHAQSALKTIIRDNDLHQAFFRPWFPDVELV